jgi:hypothetical protein
LERIGGLLLLDSAGETTPPTRFVRGDDAGGDGAGAVTSQFRS